MASAAAALIVIGILAMLSSIYLKMTAKRINKTPFLKTGEAAQQTAGNAVSVEGNVICPQPLLAPYSGTPCLYYEISVTAESKQGDTVKRKEIKSDKVAARFSIDDGSGPVVVDAIKGGDFPTQTKSETKSSGLVAGITGADLTFGNYTVSTGVLSMGTKYTLREEVMTVHPRLYVNGAVANGGGIATPSGIMKSLLISEHTRDHLLASSLKNSKLTLIGGSAGFAVGVVLAIVNSLLFPKTDAAAAAASANASATASVAAALPAPEAPAIAASADHAAAADHKAAAEPGAHAASATGHVAATATSAHAAAGASKPGAAAGVSLSAGAAAGAKPAATAAVVAKPVAAKAGK